MDMSHSTKGGISLKKRAFIGLSVLLVLSLLLSACGGSKQEQNDAGAGATDPSKPVELSVFAPQQAGIENMDVNKFSKYIEDKLGIKFNWSTVPDAGFSDKKLLLLASGDYPAVIMNAGISKADQIKYGQQGAFIPLNDLIDQYAPNIKKAMEDVSYLKQGMVAPDGKIYALPKLNECLHCTYGQRMWINTSWLEKLGLSMPTTTDEFYNVLKAFKEKDPNGNGKADEIPFTTSSDGVWGGGVDSFLMNAFIYDNTSDYLSIKDGQVIYSPAQPEWKEGLKYLRKLFAEGLMDKAVFTQNNDAVKQLANKPDAAVGTVGYALLSSAFSVDDSNPRHKDYDVVPPLKGPNGVQLTGYSIGAGDGSFVITNKATKEEQVAAIKLADYLWSEEGTVMTSWGFEGEGWKKPTAASWITTANRRSMKWFRRLRPRTGKRRWTISGGSSARCRCLTPSANPLPLQAIRWATVPMNTAYGWPPKNTSLSPSRKSSILRIRSLTRRTP